MSMEDLTGYMAKIRQPYVKQLAGFTFLTPPPPSLGFIVPTSKGRRMEGKDNPSSHVVFNSFR